MAEARQVADWNTVSVLWALLAEINRDAKKKKEPFEPADIHPYLEKPKGRTMTIGEAAKMHQALNKHGQRN